MPQNDCPAWTVTIYCAMSYKFLNYDLIPEFIDQTFVAPSPQITKLIGEI